VTSTVRIYAAILLVVVYAAAGCGAAPPLEDPIPPPGQVNIIRDIWGVPHVYAENERDALFGVGYALAKDNLEQILFRYVVLNAKAAEIFGTDFLGADLFVRRYKILQESRSAYAKLPPEIQVSYIAYMAGMRRFMDEHPSRLPDWWSDQIELEPVLPAAFWYWLSLVMSVSNGAQDCQRGGMTIDLQLKDRGFVRNETFNARQSTFIASNQFVLMNSRTKDDVLFLVNDNHTTFEAQRAELRIHAGSLHTSGVTVAGYPLPGVGHTRTVGWANTTGGPDTADCFEFQVDPENAGKYLFDGDTMDFIVEEIKLAIKDQPSQTIVQKYVQKGGLKLPVLAEKDGKVYTVATGEMGRAGALDRTYALMNRAKTVDDVLRALQNGYFFENIMAADTNGEAIYVRTGMAPIRPPGNFDWRKIVPGGTSATNWRGIHPLSDLVQTRNPASGYMQNNNVPPNKMIADDLLPNDLRPAGYPGYIYNTENQTNSRGLRAIELLSAMTNATLEDFSVVVFDEKWISAEKWSAALAGAIATSEDWANNTEEVRAYADRIVNFNGVASKESVSALNLQFWLKEVANLSPRPREILRKVLAQELLAIDEQAVLREAVHAAADHMESRYGSTTLAYGDVFGIGRGDVWEPVGGGIISFDKLWREQPLRAFGFQKRAGEAVEFTAMRGQINPIIMTVNINGEIESSSVVPFGQSHDRESIHYSDQSKLVSDRTTKPSFFEYDDLKGNIESIQTISTQ